MNRQTGESTLSWWWYLGILGLGTFLTYLFLFVSFKTREEDNTITIYSYNDMLSSEVFDLFEKESGIKVHVKYFETVEELMTKLTFSSGEGYDVIAPTDSMIELLRKEGMIQKLDKSLLSNFSFIDPGLSKQFYDPGNEYTLPFAWSPIGIGYNKKSMHLDPKSVTWDVVFGRFVSDTYYPPAFCYEGVDNVCLGEDPWETLFLASLHLYGRIDNLSGSELEHIVSLLRHQKGHLESYTNNLKYFLISGISTVVVTPGAYVYQLQKTYPHIDFVLPTTGSLMIVGGLAIPTKSHKQKLAYKVINYLTSVAGGLRMFEEHFYAPSNSKAYSFLPKEFREHHSFLPQGKMFQKLHAAHNQIPLEVVEHMWHKIKL